MASLSTRPEASKHPAVAVVGELVEAGVGHQHGVVAEVLGQIAQRDVEDAVLGNAGRTGGVLVLVARHPEQHQPADAGGHRVGGRPAQRVAGVLHDAGHGRDRRAVPSMPSATNIGNTKCLGSSEVCATSRRIAGVDRSRRGR